MGRTGDAHPSPLLLRWLAAVAPLFTLHCTLDLRPIPPARDGSQTSCPAAPDQDTVARYDLDEAQGTTLADVRGGPAGRIVDPGGAAIVRVPGGICRHALHFARVDRNDVFAVIPADPRFRLDVGAIDLWVKLDAEVPFTAGVGGILSRATKYDLAGELMLQRACDGGLFLRVKTSAGQRTRCSAPVIAGRWYHVGVNFGPPDLELYVDGKRTERTGTVTVGSRCDTAAACGGATDQGIGASDSPFVLGALSLDVDPTGSTGSARDLLGGVIDTLQISRARRVFGATQ